MVGVVPGLLAKEEEYTTTNCYALGHVWTVCLLTNAQTDVFWKVFLKGHTSIFGNFKTKIKN